MPTLREVCGGRSHLYHHADRAWHPNQPTYYHRSQDQLPEFCTGFYPYMGGGVCLCMLVSSVCIVRDLANGCQI